MASERTPEERRTRRMFGAGLAAAILGALLLAGMFVPVGAGATTRTIDLHNDTAGVATDCPTGPSAYWHFVLAPNNGSASFVSITLNLNGTTRTFSGAEILKNGTQTDNVFVAVPAGKQLTDLRTAGSSAEYTGETPNQFNLSTVCPGGGGSTTTTTTEGTTSTTEGTTSTTEGTTSTTEATTSTTEATTSTTEATTSTTEATTSTTEATTSTTEATTSTTEATTSTTEATTSTTEGTTSTTQGTTSTTQGTTSTSVSPTTSAASTTSTIKTEVLGETVTRDTVLPKTGTAALLLGALAVILVVAGAVLMLAARRRATPPTSPTSPTA